MKAASKYLLLLLLILTLFLSTTQSANASVAEASDGKAAAVILAVVGVGVLIGIGAYYFATHHDHSLKGCAAANAQLLNEGDQQMYTLSGNISAIKAGELLRVKGKKQREPNGVREFEVTRVTRDYGPCAVQP